MSRLSSAARRLSCCALLLLSPTALADGLELVDAGQEPRRSLLLETQAGATEKVRMVMLMNTSMGIAGNQIPAMTLPGMVLDLDLKVDDVSPQGDVSYTAVIAAAELAPTPDAMPEVVQQMGTAMASLVGTRMEVTTTADRRTSDAKIVAAPGSDATFAEQMSQGMDATSAQVPSQPVGLGAVWTVHDSGEQGGIALDVQSTYTVTALTEGSVMLDVSVTQTAAEGALDLAGMPPGAKATLELLESTGGGQSVMHTDRVMPMSGKVAVSLSMEATIEAEGQRLPMSMEMSIDNEITAR